MAAGAPDIARGNAAERCADPLRRPPAPIGPRLLPTNSQPEPPVESPQEISDVLVRTANFVPKERLGPTYAAGLRQRRPRPGDKWYLDEALLKIRGKRHWLWRAVDQDGIVLDILVQGRRDQAAAERFLRQVLHSCEYEPRVVITDKLASYVPVVKRVLPRSEHRRHKRLNNRAENSHLPTRKRERVLQRFKSAEHAQRFLSPFSAVCNHFRLRRHRLTASAYRQVRTERHATWLQVTVAGVRP